MPSTPLSPEAGRQLRAARQRLRLSTREVERLSQEIAAAKCNQEYYISHAWLHEVENAMFTPSIYKLYSLSIIYQRSFDEVLGFFGILIRDIGQMQMSVGLPHTHLLNTSPDDPGPQIAIPLELRQNVVLERTNLVSRMFESWTALPLQLLQQMDLRNSVYGYIGNKDYTLHPLIRPGSLVQIDQRQTKIGAVDWQTEFDRPVYFVELRDRYVCAWCELEGSQLRLIPHPQSREPVRQVRFPLDADIVGRVTAVLMRLADPPHNSARPSGSLV